MEEKKRFDKLMDKLKKLDEKIKKLQEEKGNDKELARLQREFTKLYGEWEALDDELKMTVGDRARYNSIILFDEIEKAHPDLHDILLQIIDGAELPMSNGRITYFQRSIIIMTSNVGEDRIKDILSGHTLGFKGKMAFDRDAVSRKIEEVALEELKDKFRTEFLGRLDARVVF